ncbi:serine/threonine protein kinase [Streptomyces griseofuscus]|uniref:serine/threonine protein kinase n=1 Tax=Streptomyces griseofuscus TaxID=146922 RepID=UPI0034532566
MIKMREGMTMLKSKTAAVGVASAVLALGATVGLAGTASAAAAATTPAAACGSGYTVRGSHSLGSATVYILRNGTNACVVTFKTGSAIGNSVEIGAWIGDSTGYSKADVGKYATYAGPVKENSSCVQWGGHYGSTSWYDTTPC